MTTNPESFATPELRAIAVLRCPAVVHHQAPRQSGLGRGPSGEIRVHQSFQNGLADLDGFSHIWLLFWCHHARGAPLRVQPPRDAHKRGVFATRSPQRPNPIGMSVVRLLGRDRRILRIADHDLLDGTPILDIKPYLPYCDSIPDATTGYVGSLPESAPDHRAWWRDKAIDPPACYRPLLSELRQFGAVRNRPARSVTDPFPNPTSEG
ncbi:MAG: tRNA (N6-threonylcarbamoyladenosine(37)-N6)-methyltransferase TrmO [Planctomycetes bacterium]|nr:tRNA (N6-threonylcarbamoyladenosine(37)-N6)-methyltransferase TrmO [Planctomycetota bacterium]